MFIKASVFLPTTVLNFGHEVGVIYHYIYKLINFDINWR